MSSPCDALQPRFQLLTAGPSTTPQGGQIIFFQSVALLGYCLCPLTLAAIFCLVRKPSTLHCWSLSLFSVSFSGSPPPMTWLAHMSCPADLGE